jgi:protocatechuate 3,4-dioxygenase beta subunit
MKARSQLRYTVLALSLVLSGTSLMAESNVLLSPTVPLTEGPFYKTGTPERTQLAGAKSPGRHIIISGTVYDLKGAPLPGAWLDFWQADAAGRYDNSGFQFRGHQFADAQGRYILSTVVPGEYPGRTAHIHVKLRAAGGAVLTTQIFFPVSVGINQIRYSTGALL